MFEDFKNLGNSNPWESRQQIGISKALVQTVYQVAFKPGEFFRGLKIKESLVEPFLFYFAMTLISFLATLPSSLYMYSLRPMQMSPQVAYANFALGFGISVVFVFLSAGVLHLIAKLFGGKAGYRETFSVVAYGSAVSLLSAIPYGGFIVFIWTAIICVIGFKNVHQMNMTRAILAYLTFPLLIILVFMIMVFQARGTCPVNPRQYQNQSTAGQTLPLPPR